MYVPALGIYMVYTWYIHGICMVYTMHIFLRVPDAWVVGILVMAVHRDCGMTKGAVVSLAGLSSLAAAARKGHVNWQAYQ